MSSMMPMLLLTALAMCLRLLGAAIRPVWVNEAATAIFTAGNSSWSTPINTLVPLDSFVNALRLDQQSTLLEALAHLRLEDNQPPPSFALSALVARLMQPHGAVLDPLVARLPAAVLGSLAVAAVGSALGDRNGLPTGSTLRWAPGSPSHPWQSQWVWRHGITPWLQPWFVGPYGDWPRADDARFQHGQRSPGARSTCLE